MFIFEKAPFPSCHAATLVEAAPGKLLAAWFGGKSEGAKDVKIWLSSFDGKAWSKVGVVAEERGQPCWNPVLFKTSKGTLYLYYKAGPSPQTWSGFVKRSADEGKTWTQAEILPAGVLGPIKNKPVEVKGAILSPTSVESYRAWCSWVERSTDDGRTWVRHGPIQVPGKPHGLIQPTLFPLGGDRVLALCRSRGIGAVCAAESSDGGLTWSAARATGLPNPNSGIDGVRGADGHLYLAYNDSKLLRTPLVIGRSKDGGKTWETVATAEDTVGEYSYPCLIQSGDGRLHLAYTHNRRHIKYLSYDPKALK